MAKKLDYLLKFDLEEVKKMMLSGYNLFNSEVISEITQGSETPLSVAVE